MGMLKAMVWGLIGFSIYSTVQQRSRNARHTTAKPEPLQRWEDEGGNVPAANPALQSAEGVPTPLHAHRMPD